MRISASKTKVMSALIPGEHRQAVLLDGEPLENVDKLTQMTIPVYPVTPPGRLY